MSTYYIGDVHGCYDELMALLAELRFDQRHDRLVFVGDLMNRGPKSLQVLRFVRDLGNSAQLVLGNHDLSLLAYAADVFHGRGTDFPDMMLAPDIEPLLVWLRQQPLLIHDESRQIIVTHAGIPPRWSLEKAVKQARKAEKKLRGKHWQTYLHYAYGGGDEKWSSDFDKYDKFRYRLNGFARLRYCDEDGEPDFKDKCPVGQQGEGLSPWFDCRKSLQSDGQVKVIFGHWAALGYYTDTNAICLDSGCAWGGQLTAICIENETITRVQVDSQQKNS